MAAKAASILYNVMKKAENIVNGSNYVIRNLQPSDYLSLLTMYRDFQPKNYTMGLPPTADTLRVQWLRNLLHEKLNLVALCGNRIIGHASLIEIPKTDLCEYIVFVHQDYRGLGIGRKLTEETCRQASMLGKKKIWLMVESSNQAAVRIYLHMGFRIKKVYGEVYEMILEQD